VLIRETHISKSNKDSNFESQKGQELLQTKKAALCFHWKSLRRSVRVNGDVETVSDAEADAYLSNKNKGLK